MSATKEPAAKVEITPEMIEAGARVLMDQCDLLRGSASNIARVVFEEMTRGERSNPSDNNRDRR